jgi:hypothetical protein
MSRLFQATFAVQPGEGRRIGWLLLHSLFLGVFSAFYFSAASGLFLERFGPRDLPGAYIVSGLVGYATIGLFSLLQRRISRFALFLAQLGFLVAVTGALWGVSCLTDNPWGPFALFVWIVPALTLLNLEFWGLASRLFDLRQGKRLFGLVSAGESVSAILGYILVPLLLEYLFDDPIHLLALAVTGLLGCILVVLLMGRRFPGELTCRPEDTDGRTPAVRPDVWRSRYFFLIAGLIVLAVLANYLIDFNFLSQVRSHFHGAGSVARFVAVFFGLLKVIELPVRGLLAGRLLSSFGLRAGLGLLPITLLLCTAGAAAAGALLGEHNGFFFLFVALGKLLWLALRRSIFDPSVRVLYQPLGEGERLAVQTRVEGLIQQLGTGLAGALLLVFTRGSWGALEVCFLLLPLLAGFLLLAGILHREYRERLLRNLSGQSGHFSTGTAGLAAAPGSEDEIKRRIEDLMETAAWSFAALLDLQGEPAAREVRQSLRSDLLGCRDSLYRLAALLYDPRALRLIRRNLERGGREAEVYALEMLDLLISPDLKPVVLPLMEKIPPAQALSRLEGFAPQPRLGRIERLCAIVHRENDALSKETRVSALQALGELSDCVRDEMVACLHHPEPLLQEAAARVVFRLDPAAWARCSRKLPLAIGEKLDRLVKAGTGDPILPRPGETVPEWRTGEMAAPAG